MIKVSALEAIALEREYVNLCTDVVSGNESFFGNIKEGISKAAKAIWETLVKFFKWVLGFFTKKKTEELNQKAERVTALEKKTPNKVSEDVVKEAESLIVEVKNNKTQDKETPATPKTDKTISKDEAFDRFLDKFVTELQVDALACKVNSSYYHKLFTLKSLIRNDNICSASLDISKLCHSLVDLDRWPREQIMQKLAGDIQYLVSKALGLTVKPNNIKTIEDYEEYASNVLTAINDYVKDVSEDKCINITSKVKAVLKTVTDERRLKTGTVLLARAIESADRDLQISTELCKNLDKYDMADSISGRILTKTGNIALRVSTLMVNYHKGYIDLANKQLHQYEKFLEQLNAKTA